MPVEPFADAAVASAFEAFAPPLRRRLMALRALVFDTAAALPGVGALEETLKWGEPAYLTPHSRSGSTIRIGRVKAHTSRYAMYFNCQTTLVDSFRTLFPHDFRFEGNRALVFDVADAVPTDALRHCIAAALTYHVRAPQRRRAAAR